MGRSIVSATATATATAEELSYRQAFSLPQRLAESQRIREKFPGRVPVIVERAPRSDVPPIDKKKYLVPGDLTAGQFIYVVRKRLSLPPEKALFLFCENTLPTTSTLMREIYSQFMANDGFLYCVYSGESSFGN
jgi:GABA(A) receptor-associated protein